MLVHFCWLGQACDALWLARTPLTLVASVSSKHSLMSLYVLGLNKEVERVDIADVHLVGWSVSYLDQVLEGLCPSKLLLRVGYTNGPYGDIKHDVEQLGEVLTLSEEVADDITHLALDVKVDFAQLLGDEFVVRTILHTVPGPRRRR